MNRTLKTVLAKHFSAEELRLLVGAYDVVGDMAIMIIPESLAAKESEIGQAVLQNSPNIRVVAKRKGQYGGEFRTIELEVIAGAKRKETMVKEFGIRLLLDPSAVYYSVRSAVERRRVASLVLDKERVLVLFSGIAPFPLMISKYSRAERIVAVEKNPIAHQYALKNLRLNRKCSNITLCHGDAADVVPRLDSGFDRVLMVLPMDGEAFLPTALSALRPGGTLHFYDMQKIDRFGDSAAKVMHAGCALGRQVVSTAVTKCGHCSPRTYRICVQAVVA
jgi:tRNA (guanine37-N1)-methyltransferase